MTRDTDTAAIARHIDRITADPVEQARAVAVHAVGGGMECAAGLLDELANNPRVLAAAQRDPAATLRWIAARLRAGTPS